MASRFYVTTPIYYINDVPHLGSAYTTIAADVLARYHRVRGHDTRFLTGTDEHGLKIQRAAAEKGVTPAAFADSIAPRFAEAWRGLDCAFDDFIRTSEARHVSAVQKIWSAIAEKGDLTLGHYEGLYCVACEAYYTEKELDPDNLCPIHKTPAETVKEESYFFKLSKYQDALLELYRTKPEFVQPATRRNEVVSFVEGGLQDLSVSRTTFQWGVPVPGDPRHIMYVWFDALANYWTALGDGEARAYFPSCVHLMGKDILRFHAVYWPAFLMAAGLPLPKQVFAHGFLTYGGQKMSKTLRNTVSPVELARAISPDVGADVVRYALMRAISFGQDGDFSIEDVLGRYASELGNSLGNLLNRVIKPFGATVPAKGEVGPLEEKLAEAHAEGAAAAAKAFDDISPTRALEAIWGVIGAANEYVDRAAPWAAKKSGDAARLGTIVATLIDELEAISVMVYPVLPTVADRMRAQLGLAKVTNAVDRDQWPAVAPTSEAGRALAPGEPIFPRFEKEKHAELVARFSAPKPDAPKADAPKAAAPKATAHDAPKADVVATPAREAKATIAYDDFAKVELRVGVVLSAERVKKKDKLLDLRVDAGDAAPRRIVAGIAGSYAPEQLVGKRVVLLANLAPRDFGKGLVSEGMLLAADGPNGLVVTTVDGDAPPGSSVS